MRKVNLLKIDLQRKKAKWMPHRTESQWRSVYTSRVWWYFENARQARIADYWRWAVFTII
jgi:hypothetical protein